MAVTEGFRLTKEPVNAKPIIRPATPNDYIQIEHIISDRHGGWPGIVHNTQHDIVAMTCPIDDSPSPTTPVLVLPDGQIIGVSLNLVRASGQGNVLYVHMLAVNKIYRGKGFANLLMDENYRLIKENELKGVDKVALTSDPLEASLVYLYMHRYGMQVNKYKPDLYVGLANTGGSQNRGIPADRFWYESNPKSPWVNNRTLPTKEEYSEFLKQTGRYIMFSAQMETPQQINEKIKTGAGIAFVETPDSAMAAKAISAENAIGVRAFQNETFTRLFAQGHTAVDIVSMTNQLGNKHNYIVTMTDFDENDPQCLIRRVK